MSRHLFFAISLAFFAGCQPAEPASTPGTPVAVSAPVPPPPAANGLAGIEADRWHHLSQGSELYPYRFLQALYIVEDKVPFIEHLDRFGFVPDAKSASNPEGVPLGMTVSPTKDLAFAGVRMIGINCSACHTTILEKDGKVVAKIDGGQSFFNIRGFIGSLASNTKKTFENKLELLRFTARLLKFQLQDDNPHSFTTRLLAAGGDKLLTKITTLEEFGNRGPIEKQLLADLDQILADERNKAVLPLQQTLKTKADHPELKQYAAEAPSFFAKIDWKNPIKLANAAIDLRKQIHGDPLKDLRNFQALSAVDPGDNSPLMALEAEARRLEIRSGIGNIISTLRLLKARYEFLASIGGKPDPTAPDPMPGRVDAFGSARNSMFPNTPVSLSAPVSFPHLWNIKEIPWYHWDNNTTSELERNVGEAIGVGVIYTPQFDSTIRIDNIKELEGMAGKITPPVWPAQAFGQIVQEKAQRGKVLFDAKCSCCHETWEAGKKLQDKKYALALIGTDPLRATNFALPMGEADFVTGLSPLLKSIINANGGAANNLKNWRTTQMYSARPLSAIWATAPYLHNGSVSSIYELLLPEAQRKKDFIVGLREYDPVNLGYVTEGSNALSKKFDTTIKGNWNVGHSGEKFGTEWTDAQRYDLIEYLKAK